MPLSRLSRRAFFKNAGMTAPKVHLNPGSKYGLGGERHVRMNVASPRKLIDRALDNMANALAKL